MASSELLPACLTLQNGVFSTYRHGYSTMTNSLSIQASMTASRFSNRAYLSGNLTGSHVSPVSKVCSIPTYRYIRWAAPYSVVVHGQKKGIT
jgi:hypothetical protein